MAEVCPDAWLLNYTNPMAMLCWATYAGARSSGSSGSATRSRTRPASWPSWSSVPFEEVTFLGAGVNHQAFILRFERDGESLYPQLDEAIERDPELLRRVRVQMYRAFGYFPTESSSHSAEYLPWFMHHDDEIERMRIRSRATCRESEENLAEYERNRERLASGEPLPIEPIDRVRAADHPLDRDRTSRGSSTATSRTPA